MALSAPMLGEGGGLATASTTRYGWWEGILRYGWWEGKVLPVHKGMHCIRAYGEPGHRAAASCPASKVVDGAVVLNQQLAVSHACVGWQVFGHPSFLNKGGLRDTPARTYLAGKSRGEAVPDGLLIARATPRCRYHY